MDFAKIVYDCWFSCPLPRGAKTIYCIPSCGDNSSTFSEQIRYFRTVSKKFLICSLKVDELSPHEGILVLQGKERRSFQPASPRPGLSTGYSPNRFFKFFFSWNLLSWFVAFQCRLNFANQMKTELSLLALKLRQMLKLFATWCSWCSR
jgi:hypothetical protein